MNEVLSESVAWYNLPLTVMLGLVFVYWLLVIVGALGMESIDVDAGVDADAGMDIDGDGHLHHEGGGIGGAVLKFLNFGHVPAMLVISVLVLVMWLLSMLGNYIFNGAGSLLVAGGVFFGSLFAGAIAAKVLTAPLKPLFRELNKADDSSLPVVGSVCCVRSLEVTPSGGQAEIERSGATVLINVRVVEGRESLRRGDHALVVGKDDEKDIYIIKED